MEVKLDISESKNNIPSEENSDQIEWAQKFDEIMQELKKKSLTLPPVEFIEWVLKDWYYGFDDVIIEYLKSNADKMTSEEKSNIVRIIKEYAVSDDDELFRSDMAKLLGYVCTDDLSMLEEWLTDSDSLVRCEALESLVRLRGAEYVDKAVEMFRTDEDTLVRIVAIRQLATMENVRLTYIFMEALEKTCSEEIYSAACMALAERVNRKVYRFLRRHYIRARSRFDRICLSYALYLHGEKDKLKKICSALTAQGKENTYVRYEAAMFLDFIYWQSKYKKRKLILEKLKEALPNEPLGMISGSIKISIDNMEPDIEEYLQKTGKKPVALI
jgi:hypothetical protein